MLHAELGNAAFVALGACALMLPLETVIARRQAAFTKARVRWRATPPPCYLVVLTVVRQSDGPL